MLLGSFISNSCVSLSSSWGTSLVLVCFTQNNTDLELEKRVIIFPDWRVERP